MPDIMDHQDRPEHRYGNDIGIYGKHNYVKSSMRRRNRDGSLAVKPSSYRLFLSEKKKNSKKC